MTVVKPKSASGNVLDTLQALTQQMAEKALVAARDLEEKNCAKRGRTPPNGEAAPTETNRRRAELRRRMTAQIEAIQKIRRGKGGR